MRKRILESNMMSWVGTRVSALCSLALVVPMAISLSSCEPNECPNPNPNPAKEKGAGVEVLIEYENSLTGHTRTVSADSNYSFEKKGGGGIIEAQLCFKWGFRDTKLGK